MALTLKQQLWLEHYLGDAHGNATRAARDAGYSGDQHVLAQMGADNLVQPEIAARIRAHVDATGATAEWVLARLYLIAAMDPREFFSAGKDSKATLADTVRALELLGKYHRLFVDRTETESTAHKRIEIISIRAVPQEEQRRLREEQLRQIDGTAREIERPPSSAP